ncbi:uncharacterized protein LOC125238026 [Leguminivora glycinivorella]|uniref:uncharacterized protein LOC125238026 n=1 Tax=Leguminivora glycinivorella TaxID=1035111 RepID=UPI00200BEC2C|nr:uncharacterized protein LOC125238026 [Leguminivora glycinivorella]XP_048001264.1 uncharacterized protein LOC125238026 [Leguminivora glycinivorella]
MCKRPAPECKQIAEENQLNNEAEEENDDNAMSEDEDDTYGSDSESSYSESSVNMRTESESDGESASAHRVTPDMVLLLMLKDKGAITEEKYAEKAEKCDRNFRSLIPYVPRSRRSSYEADDSNDEDENDAVETSNKNEVECDKDITKDIRSVENVGNENIIEGDSDSVKNDSNIALDVNNDLNCEEILLDKQKGSVSDNQTKCEVEEKIPIVPKLTCELNADSAIQDTNRDTMSESINLKSMNNDNDSQKQVENSIVEMKNKLEHNLVPVDNKITEPNLNAPKDLGNQVVSSKPEETKEGHNSEVEKRISLETILLQELNLLRGDNNNSIKDENEHLLKTKAKAKDADQNSKDENETNSLPKESTLESVEHKSKETSNNDNQSTNDLDLAKKSEKSKIENKNCQTESNSTGKLTKSFKYILKKLIRENRIPREDEDRINDAYGEDYGDHLLSFTNSLDTYYKNNTNIELSDDEYEEDINLREFAVFLNFYSPSSYKHILETYNTPLPDSKVLYSWYLKDDYYPGLTKQAFKILKEKSSVKKLTCTLMLIDVYLKNEGEYCDQVDYGQGENVDCEDKAVLAYVFVLVSVDEDWKMPIGYIFARNIPAETQAEYIRICLTHCHEAGADVVAVTLENPTPAEFLGCSFNNIRNLKTTFRHPSCDREVAVWIDPCLALKSARQTLKVKGVLKDHEGKKIRWNLIRKLQRMPTDHFIDMEDPEFYELKNHIAKIDLTVKTFSESLVTALSLAEKLLPDDFTDVEPTRRYIAFINLLYDILNTKVTVRMRDIAVKLQSAKNYLLHIFFNEENELTPLDRENLAWLPRRQGYRYFLKGEPICGFIGFLICIKSFKHLYSTLIKKEKRITGLDPQRLCKVQAENLVNNLRAYTWADPDSLSGDDFRRFYKNLFGYIEKNPQFSDKTVPLEHWPLTNNFSPMVTIKMTSGKRSYDDVYSGQYRLKKMKKTDDEKSDKCVRDLSKAMDAEIDLSVKKNMVGFLAGWIAAKFAKCLKCEDCINLVFSDNKLWFHKHITLSWIYALCLPSEEMFRICWECERALRLKGSLLRLKAWVLRRLASKFPWSRGPKISKHRPMHHIHLVRAVIGKYFALRVPTPFGKKDREKIVELYQQFTTVDSDASLDKYRIKNLEEWLDGSKEEVSDY